ncbi:MAG: hypothetical protein ABI995_04105 [Acidobacteriota bacterium]
MTASVTSKLLLAFSAGSLLGAGVLFFAGRPASPGPTRLMIVPAQAVSKPVPEVPAETVAAPEQPPVVPHAVPQNAPGKLAPRKSLRAFPPLPRAFRPLKVERAAIPLQDVVLDASLPPLETTAPDPLPIETASTSLPQPAPQTVTVNAGTLIQVRLAERLASDRNETGDTFNATLDQPLVVDGWIIAERGARVLGRVRDVDQAGRVQGVATLTVELTSLTTSDGQKIPLRTAGFVRKGDTSKKADVIKVGIGAVLGATIGAAANGGKGAAVGAAAGGGAGAAAVALTRGKAAALEVETRLSFRLDQAVAITERR